MNQPVNVWHGPANGPTKEWRSPGADVAASSPSRTRYDAGLTPAYQNPVDDLRPAKDGSIFTRVLSPFKGKHSKNKSSIASDSMTVDDRETDAESMDSRLHGTGVDDASTKGTVNAGLSPRDDRDEAHLTGNAETPLEHTSHPPPATLNTPRALDTPRIVEPDLNAPPFLAEPHTPVVAAAQGMPVPTAVESKLDKATFYEADADASEMEAHVDASVIDDAQAERKAREDLVALCVSIKNIAPGHPDMMQCNSAERAVQIIGNVYREALNGWRREYSRAQNLELVAAEVEDLRHQKNELGARNRELEKDEKLLVQTERTNALLEAENQKLKQESDTKLETERNAYEAQISQDRATYKEQMGDLTRQCTALRESNENLRQIANASQEEAGRHKKDVQRLHELVKSNLTKAQAENRRIVQEREKLVVDHREQLAALENFHADDVRPLQDQIAMFEGQRISENAKHEAAMEALRNEHAQTIQLLRNEHLNALMLKDDELKDTADRLEQSQRSELLQRDQKIQRLREQHATQLDDQVRRHNDQVRELHGRVNQLRDEAHQVEDRVRKEYLKAERELKLNHQQQLKEVKQDREDLVGALVKRDGFKGIADRTVEARFKKLAKAVDQLSRTCCNLWDRGREAEWPCSERTLASQDNVRQVKQYLVQNAIWTTIYDNVFDTPFKSFGLDGDEYFRNWIASFGESKWRYETLVRQPFLTSLVDPLSAVAPHWPEPSQKCEEWRYNTMTTCIEAVEKASGDPMLKRAFVEGVQRVCDDITRDLNRVVANTANLQKFIKDIAHQATKLWLDLGEQRCRILILIPPESRGTSGKIDRAGLRELVVQPEILRIGNAQGENLETQEVVICKMELHSLRLR
jgi:hypothetical protein